MGLLQTEDLGKIKREKTREAINFALQGKWADAVEVNRALLKLFTQDVEAHNRLGKAYLELGQYPEACATLEKALVLDPRNSIAKKNLERLAALRPASGTGPRPVRRVTPATFIEESGRSAMVALHDTATREVLAKLSAGESVTIKALEHGLAAETAQGDVLGLVDRRLALRLLPLIKGGNRYEAAIVGVASNRVSIIIREEYRHPSLLGTPSFPLKGTEEYRAFMRGAFVGLEDDEAEDEEGGEWQEAEEPNADADSDDTTDEAPAVVADDDGDEENEE